MTKVIKILGFAFFTLWEITLFSLILIAFFIRTSEFQTYLAKLGADYLSKELKVEIHIAKVDIVFFDRVAIDGVFMGDHHQDTLIHIPELLVNLDMRDLISGKLHLNEVTLSNTYFNLQQYEGETHSNLQPLMDYFSSDSPSSSSPFTFTIDKVNLVNSRFKFDRGNHTEFLTIVDFKHLDITKLNLIVSNVKLTKTNYSGEIKSLSLKEQSGFLLDNLVGNASFSEKGLQLNETRIITPHSTIELNEFALVTNSYGDYKEFLDEVEMISDLKTSQVALNDVAYFAEALHGMDQIVQIAAKTKRTISNLLLEDVKLNTGKNSKLEGNFQLPDFRNIASEELQQHITELSIDMSDFKNFKLPSDNEENLLILPKELMNMGSVYGSDIYVSGNINQFMLSVPSLETMQGTIKFHSPIQLSHLLDDESLFITNDPSALKFVEFKNFHIGNVVELDEINTINGWIDFDLFLHKDANFEISDFNGYFTSVKALDYNYQNVYFSDMSLNLDMNTTKTAIDGLFYVRDENLDLVYEGSTTFGSTIDLDVFIDLQCANLAQIHPLLESRGEAYAQLTLNGSGKSFKEIQGILSVDSVYYSEGSKSFNINHLDALVKRTGSEDLLKINSSFLKAELNGYVDLALITDNIIYQASQVFPAFFSDSEPVFDLNSHFTYSFDFIKINPILNIFVPEIQIANNSYISGSFNGKQDYFDLTILSDYLVYNNVRVEQLNLFQELSRGQLLALYQIDSVFVNDSIVSEEIHFTNIAENSFMDSQLIFHDKTHSRSNLEWNTFIFESTGFDIDFLPSYFNINEHLWELKSPAHINFSYDCFLVEDFKLERENQMIELNGQISKVPQDRLKIDVENFDLSDIAVFLLPENEISGRAWMSGYISEPFSELKFSGRGDFVDLIIDDREIGNVFLNAEYENHLNRIALNGDLFYQNQKTFEFEGNYLLDKDISEKLDFLMHFYKTDISIVNSFLDEDVVSGIRGNLEGDFELKGSIDEPRLEGAIELNDGRVNLALLGADFYYSGKVKADQYGIYIDAMPVKDEEGNTGFIVGQLLHDNFSNFLYELNFDFENHPKYRNPNNPSKPLKIDRFLVMKTQYEEGAVYYGNAYMTGSASVSGSAEDMTIVVNAKTKRGTWINFPMYGPTTIEEDGFITFTSLEDDLEAKIEEGINFSGVNLSLNFQVTPDARVKLIFDEELGDEITAYGQGDFLIDLDNYGDIALKGTYRLSDGVYNFAMGAYKQNFFIVPGGTVQWTGSPYSANLDIETFYKTNANLSAVMTDVVEGKSSDSEEIYSYLKLRGDMNKPEISFDLAAPRANEAGKAVIQRIRSDKDELNRQFFSILIMKRFLPLSGQENRAQQSSGSSAALDLVSTQINSLLSKVSDDYKMNVALENDQLTGESSVEFGVTKGFLDDRLVVSGSFGVGQYNQSNSNQNNLIGDLSIEYLINEKGTFRANVFNESNANSVMQNTQRGHFTQGVGVNYREDFYNFRDFKLLQFILDIFRKNKKLEYRDDSRFRSIPPEVRAKYEKKKKEN